jgi:hypothetical protein
MSGSPKAKIHNWHEYQHYKDRNPPWIKLHRELMQSEDWVVWSDDSRLLAVVCMMLAARTKDGYVTLNPAYVKKVAYLDMDPDFRPLIETGFLEDVEGDIESLKPKKSPAPKKKSRDDDGFSTFWNIYPRKVQRAAALKRWSALTAEKKKLALEAVSEHAIVWQAQGREMSKIPHASTWLNQERWEDDLSEELKKGKNTPSTNVPDAASRVETYDRF